MILSPHIITSAALGANLHNLYLLPIGAIILHHFLDRIPHYDYQIKPFSSIVALKVFLDVLIGTLIVLFTYLFINPSTNLTYSTTGMFFGTLPDGLLLASFIFNNKWLQKYQKFHSFLHFNDRKNIKNSDENLTLKELFRKRFFWLGLFTQFTMIIIALYFII